LIHIPGWYPDRTEVEPETMECFMKILDRQFGGTPILHRAREVLTDEKTVEEPMHRIEVAVKRADLATFRKLARAIGRQTKQKEMYVVINYQAEVNSCSWTMRRSRRASGDRCG